MPTYQILIVAINARHSHASLVARYLLANMGDLRLQTELVEFTLQYATRQSGADAVIARNPRDSVKAPHPLVLPPRTC